LKIDSKINLDYNILREISLIRVRARIMDTFGIDSELPDRGTWDLPPSDAGSTITRAGGMCVYAQRFGPKRDWR